MHSLTTCGECDPPTPGLNLRRNSKPIHTGRAMRWSRRSDRALPRVKPCWMWGRAGGRLALPLALTCQTVTAVEPSPSMCSVLRETALEHHIGNVPIVESGWMEASVEPADVVLCSHVVYVVEEIGPFVRKMDSHARRLVLAVHVPVSAAICNVRVVGAGSRRKTPRLAQPAGVPSGFGGVGHSDRK